MTHLLLRKVSEPRPGAEGQDDVIGDVERRPWTRHRSNLQSHHCTCRNALDVETDCGEREDDGYEATR
jgi:hypothetical protein